MHYALFFLYLILFSWLIRRSRFVRESGIPQTWIVPLFMIKAAAGVMIGWLSQKFYPGNDYWAMNREAQLEYQLLVSDPRRFVSSILYSPYNHYAGFFDSVGSYWNDLKNNLIIKVLAVIHTASRGNYYTSSLFLNLFSFMGLTALYRVFIHLFPGKYRQITIGCFLIPSTLYFCSGIYKDLVVLALLGFYLHALYFWVTGHRSKTRIISLLLSFLGLLLIRNYVAVLLVPLSGCFIVAMPSQSRARTVSIYLAGALLVFAGAWLLAELSPGMNVLSVITQKQRDFAALPTAVTALPAPILDGSTESFAKGLPVAFNHAFMRPYLWDNQSPFLLPMAIELLFCQLLVLMALFYWDKSTGYPHPFVILTLALSVILLLLDGLIVPNIGSMVRYRSVVLPLLMTPILCISDLGQPLRKLNIKS